MNHPELQPPSPLFAEANMHGLYKLRQLRETRGREVKCHSGLFNTWQVTKQTVKTCSFTVVLAMFHFQWQKPSLTPRLSQLPVSVYKNRNGRSVPFHNMDINVCLGIYRPKGYIPPIRSLSWISFYFVKVWKSTTGWTCRHYNQVNLRESSWEEIDFVCSSTGNASVKR